jgi:hypothetical protein
MNDGFDKMAASIASFSFCFALLSHHALARILTICVHDPNRSVTRLYKTFKKAFNF